MTEARFTVEVDAEAPIAFARLSGDWNPLHTRADYAARTPFGRPVLHGAYLSGLLSRLAGMFLPGEKCLLHGISLRFIAPVQPPVTLAVADAETHPRRLRWNGDRGGCAARITDAVSGTAYAEGHYDFGLHTSGETTAPAVHTAAPATAGASTVLVTGGSGALARAVLAKLSTTGALGVSRSSSGPGLIKGTTAAEIEAGLEGRRTSPPSFTARGRLPTTSR